MISFEEIKTYLPKYLSPAAEAELFAELRAFPENIDSRFYTAALEHHEVIYQGDGLRDLLVVNLPDTRINGASCMVLSNTCDVDPGNKRFLASTLCYAPILSLPKYESMLAARSVTGSSALAQHLSAIRKQRVTQIFYLPQGAGLETEAIVFLDRICHCANEAVERTGLRSRRVFTLSNYAAYLFLLKLSIHFTRLNDQLDRTAA